MAKLNSGTRIYGNVTVDTFVTAASTVGGVITGSSASVTGNITGGNVLGGANVNATTHTGTTVSVSGAVTAASVVGGVITGSSASVTGNITGGNITIPGSANISTFIGNVFFGTVPAQPTWYTIAPLNLNNSVAAATKVQLNLINTGGGSGAGSAIDFYTYQISVAAANAEARIAGIDDGNYAAYLSLQTKTPGNTGTNNLVERVKIDSTGVSVVANITGGNISATNHTGTSVSVTSTVTAASTVGGVITGSSASVTGAVTAGALLSVASVAGNSISTAGNIAGGYLFGNGSALTGIVASAGAFISNGTSNVTVASGANTTVGVAGTTVATVASTGLYIAGGTGILSATGNITGPNLSVGTGTITGGNIVNSNGNGIGNIGSSSLYFNTVFAKATSAQYADLAEMYIADAAYAPGTVVEFGGNYEITITTTTHSTQVAGIISTQPAYLMNSTQAGEHSLELALVGRVPCSVVGTIRKGDRLVSSNTPGVAQALDINQYQPGCIVGKALAEYNSAEPGVIEVAVGRS